MKAYIKIVDKLNKLLEWLVVVVLVILSFVVLAQVVTRKCHISVAWLEEMARYSMIWLCFLGAAIITKEGQLDLSRLPPLTMKCERSCWMPHRANIRMWRFEVHHVILMVTGNRSKVFQFF